MIGNYIIAFILGIFTTYIIMPNIIRLSHKIGAIDVPKQERKIHKNPTPRLGGLAIIISFIFTTIYLLLLAYVEKVINVSFFEEYKRQFIGMGLSIIIITIMGVLDDSKELNPFIKLLMQSAAAIITIYCGITIKTIDLSTTGVINLGKVLTYVISFFWIVGIMNSINLIDGLNCLSTGIVTIALTSLIVIFKLNSSPIIATILAVSLLGSIIGFIPYNKSPAKSFVGDTGTNFLGYMIAVISILGVAKTYTLGIIIAPVIALILPIMDTLFAIIRRLFTKKSLKGVFEADRGHIHHRLLKKGLTPHQVVYIFYLITACSGLLAILLLEGNVTKILTFALILAILTVLGFNDILKQLNEEKVKYLEIINEENNEKKTK